jgi:hypothetical protein
MASEKKGMSWGIRWLFVPLIAIVALDHCPGCSIPYAHVAPWAAVVVACGGIVAWMRKNQAERRRNETERQNSDARQPGESAETSR